MKKTTRLYNVIFPIWLLLIFPQVWLIVIPGNLLVDCAVLFAALAVLKCAGKMRVLGMVWWKIWLLGFAADLIGVAWMVLGLVPAWVFQAPAWWEESVGHIAHNAFSHPAAFLWTLAGVALAGVCIYFFDSRVLSGVPQLSRRQCRLASLTLAVVTAPWLFFIPVY